MTNKAFKVKFGLDVGDTVASIDGTTGNIVTQGDAAINSGDLTTTSTTASLFNTTATTVNIGGAATTVSIGANTGTTTVNNDLVADSFSGAGGTFGNVTVGVATDQTVSTTSGNLVLDSATGIITLNSSGVTGVTLTPITSQIPYTLFAGNMVKGAVRNAPTEAGGNIFSFSAAGTGGLTRGLTIDNSATGSTTQRPGIVLRAYGGGLAGGNPVTTLITETARGSAATPTGLASGNALGTWLASGYADTTVGGANPGWATDTTGSNIAQIGFITTEAFTQGTTNLGTQCSIRTNPTGSGNAVQTSMAINPQSTISRSDAFTWQNGKTNSNQKMLLDSTNILTLNATTGEVTLKVGDVNIMQANSTWQSVFSPGFKYTGLMSDSTLTGTGSYFEMSSRWKTTAGSSTFSTPLTGWGLGRFGFSADNSTTGTSQVNSGAIQAKATENWTSIATGSSLNFSANKAGVANSALEVLNMSPENTYMYSDTISLVNSTATSTYLNLDLNFATFAKPIKLNGSTSGNVNLAASATGDQLNLRNSGATPLVSGKINYGRQYIEAYSTQDQTNPVANAENLMSFNNTGISNGVSIVTNGTTLTRITMANAGVYNIQFSTQLSQTSGGNHNAFIWLKKNGTAVADSAGDVKVAGNGDRIMAAWNYIVSAAAGDYYELAWAGTTTSIVLDYVAAAAPIPAIPSVILTVVPVGA